MEGTVNYSVLFYFISRCHRESRTMYESPECRMTCFFSNVDLADRFVVSKFLTYQFLVLWQSSVCMPSIEEVVIFWINCVLRVRRVRCLSISVAVLAFSVE